MAPPLGWMQTTLDGTPTILAILSAYLRAATDGWLLAATSVRATSTPSDATSAGRSGGDFAAEAHRLGEATAEVHRALAEAFGTAELPAERARASSPRRCWTGWTRRSPPCPSWRGMRACSADAYTELVGVDEPLTVQRIHGDYHLGQVIRDPGRVGTAGLRGRAVVPLAQRRARLRRCATWRACSARSTTPPGTSCPATPTRSRAHAAALRLG